MTAADGKKRLTDVANTEELLRIIQSIPSPKAEPQTFEENKNAAKRGGQIAGNARKEIEKDTGKPVITKKNALDLSGIVSGVINEISNDGE